MTGSYVIRGTAASVSNVNKRDNSVISVALCLKKIAGKRENIVLQLAAHQVIKTTCLCTSFQMKKGQRYASSGWSLWRSRGRTSTSLPSILSFVRGISRRIHIPRVCNKTVRGVTCPKEMSPPARCTHDPRDPCHSPGKFHPSVMLRCECRCHYTNNRTQGSLSQKGMHEGMYWYILSYKMKYYVTAERYSVWSPMRLYNHAKPYQQPPLLLPGLISITDQPSIISCTPPRLQGLDISNWSTIYCFFFFHISANPDKMERGRGWGTFITMVCLIIIWSFSPTWSCM